MDKIHSRSLALSKRVITGHPSTLRIVIVSVGWGMLNMSLTTFECNDIKERWTRNWVFSAWRITLPSSNQNLDRCSGWFGASSWASSVRWRFDMVKAESKLGPQRENVVTNTCHEEWMTCDMTRRTFCTYGHPSCSGERQEWSRFVDREPNIYFI